MPKRRTVALVSALLFSLWAILLAAQSKPRARDLGVPFDGQPGPLNAITDVKGVEVGHTTLISGEGALRVGTGPVRTGVTAVLPRGKNIQDQVFAGWFTLNGNGGNNGDVYTNGDFVLANNSLIKGSVYAQRSADIGQGVVNADVWAGNTVTLSGGIQVLGNATSSTSSFTLSNNSKVFGNAKAGTTVSGGTINGTITQYSPSGPPPQVSMPKYCWPGCDLQGNPTNDTLLAFQSAGGQRQSECAGVWEQLPI